ncbi:uncharacterized protein LOC141789985 [Halichoeres trimaculatus]|uniref:uncharacterized protein LOC141789985 n=1 Tax=Halichoeres trimaculatus TaxID=147232 RepID=UPI003D9EF24C
MRASQSQVTFPAAPVRRVTCPNVFDVTRKRAAALCCVYILLLSFKMNSSMIISANSVSTTRRKREAERSVNWTVEETQVLLCAWSDERVQKSLAENLRNRHVFKHLSARMSEMGFSRSPHQCRLRVKTLKANYVRAKLHRTVNMSQPCTFKYFTEMDAVLGRRAVEGEGGGYFISPEGRIEQSVTSVNGTGSIPPVLLSNTERGGHHFGSLGRMGRQSLSSSEDGGGRQSWQLDSEVKVEDGEVSTEEFEFSNTGFQREKHEVYLDPSVQQDMTGQHVETSLSTPSPHVPPPPPPLPPIQSASPPPPAPPALPANPAPTALHHHPESPCLEPVLKHLSECFQGLVSETRSLLLQLERQREEQARWHQELLAQWLQREERRQRETAEREERREKARMEHEIRVLELLTGLSGEHRCRCGGEAAGGLSQSRDRDGE